MEFDINKDRWVSCFLSFAPSREAKIRVEGLGQKQAPVASWEWQGLPVVGFFWRLSDHRRGAVVS